MNDEAITKRSDYRPPRWLVPRIELVFDLGVDSAEVAATLQLERAAGGDEPLRLDGEGLELLELKLDGTTLDSSQYQLDATGLTVNGARDGSVLETRVRIHPRANTALEGLYLAGSADTGFLLTQCEAEGFRHITFFPDHPDVLSRYTVTLRADRARFPVLLAGGNPDGHGEADDGRHWARFVDPWPRPSYLFALVAGDLHHIDRDFVTAEGRSVAVKLWAEPEAIARCQYAFEALLRAMRWDEQTYGRCYDLDVFHVVATDAFNMGAMENKGLNIFNAKYLLADPDSSTDEDFHRVESVIGHEYFHNWSGNRVTCRDWFQLSLKEGFTVFREQSFAAAMDSPALQRIEDVRRLRRAQFSEDAGPLAHPVRPDAYREINNFYTSTVYEKGAEVVRMLARRLGPAAFRRGTDLYFSRHDGQAVTIEDFVRALGDANELDLGAYLAWYGQAGTPRVRVHAEHDAASQRLTLQLSQHTPPTPGQPDKAPLPIPIDMALFTPAGGRLPLHVEGEARPRNGDGVVELRAARQDVVLLGVAERPVLSLLRGFSAPVILEFDDADADLGVLLRHEPDGFNRWQASQRLAQRAFAAAMAGATDNRALTVWCDTLAAVCDESGDTDPALLAELLAVPDAVELGATLEVLDPPAVHAARTSLLQALALRIGAQALASRYQALQEAELGEFHPAARGRRRLKRSLLGLLAHADGEQAFGLAAAQFKAASSMSDQLAALALLVHFDAPQAQQALADYRHSYNVNMLALDKWFAVQATRPAAAALEQVEALMEDPAFELRNPNRVQSLLGSFAHANPLGFHRADGAGYRFVARQLTALDALNPQTAARIATCFNAWKRLEPGRRALAREALAELAARPENSRGVNEIVQRTLE
ncbi:MAG TPA: aminopeptidase N [Rhodanobacteraceae bacterium]|nr:aminopeptidase N [Rhodanobacteraceae bacterium]